MNKFKKTIKYLAIITGIFIVAFPVLAANVTVPQAPNRYYFLTGADNSALGGAWSATSSILTVSAITAPNIIATSTTATSTFPNLTFTNISIAGDYINDLTGSGLSVVNGALTVSGSTGFSTTSSDYWITTKTTSDIAEGSNLYWTNNRFDTRLAATTTLPNLTTLLGLTDTITTRATTTNATSTNFFATTASTSVFNIGNTLGIASSSPMATVGIQKQDGTNFLCAARGTASGSYCLNFSSAIFHALTNGGLMSYGNSVTDGESKVLQMMYPHQNLSSGGEACLLRGTSVGGFNSIIIGGGTSACKANEYFYVYNSDNNGSTTATGVQAFQIDPTGKAIFGTGATQPGFKLTVNGDTLVYGSTTMNRVIATSTTAFSSLPLLTSTDNITTRATTTNATSTNAFITNLSSTNSSTTNSFSNNGLSIGTTTNPSRSIILQKEDGTTAYQMSRGTVNYQESMFGGVPTFISSAGSLVFGSDLTDATEKITRLRAWGYNTTGALPNCWLANDSRAATNINLYGGVSVGCYGPTEHRFYSSTSTNSTYQEIIGTWNNTGLYIGNGSPSEKMTVQGSTTVASRVTATAFTATSSTATSSIPRIENTVFYMNNDLITDFTGSGLSVVGGALTVTGSASWSTTSADFYINASTTIPTTYKTNTWTGNNTFNGGLTIDALTGVLGAINGVVSATSTPTVANIIATSTTASSSLPLVIGGDISLDNIYAKSSAGLDIHSLSSGKAANFGAGGGTNTTFFGGVNIDGATRLATSLNGAVQATAGVISAGTLPVASGGTGQTSFGQGWLTSDGTTLTSSTSPTVNYITATSTTGTSTFAGSLQVNGGTLTVDAPNNMVGVGTTTPITALTVANNGARNQITMVNTSGSTNQKMWSIGTSRGNLFINSMDDIYATTTRVAIEQEGDFGIGSTSPDAVLTVVNNRNTTANRNLIVFASTTDGTSTTTQFQIAANGNVSIGTTTSNRAKLEIAHSATTPGLMVDAGASGVHLFRVFRSPSNGGVGQGLSLLVANTNPSFCMGTGMSESSTGTTQNCFTRWTAQSALAISTSTTNGLVTGLEAIIVKDTSNNVGIAGTSTPWGSLSINPTIYTPAGQPTFVIGSSTKTDFIVRIGGEVGVGTTSPSGKFAVQGTVFMNGLTTSTAGNAICQTTGGQVVNAGNTTCTTSSRRFKTDIKPIDVGLNEVLKLEPKSYTRKEPTPSMPTGKEVGLIAEQVEEVIPRLVEYEADGKTPRSVNYAEYTAVLTKAIQQLNDKIEGGVETTKKTATDNWQWLAIGLLAAWNIALTIKRK